MKKFIQLFILLIISGFISSLFVARALNKKETNYLHKVILKNIYQEPVLYGSGETGAIIYDINCNLEIVTDSKDEIKSLSDLQKYCDNHLVNGSDGNYQYFLIDATGTFFYNENTFEIHGLSYIKNTGFNLFVEPYLEDVICSGPFMEFALIENDINDDVNLFSELTITDSVKKTNKDLTLSKNIIEFVDSFIDEPGMVEPNPNS